VSLSLVIQPHQAKQLKILGVSTNHRVKEIPDVPMVSESGVPGYEAGTWFGLATTGGTPRDVVMKINAEVKKILSDPAFQEKFMAPQMFESMAATPEEFAQYIKAETATWAKVIKEQGLKIE
jgi:tripartite-type tricarboxylate transporter receptor subunit TctC